VRLAAVLGFILIALGMLAPGAALAAQSVKFHAEFTPKHPGERTTAAFSIEITSPDGSVPSPLIGANVRYPAGLGIALSGLGVAACSREALETFGTGDCPAGSFMGEGSATAEIQFGPEIVREPARISLVRAGAQEGELAMLFLIKGERPVYAQPVLTGLLLPSAAPYGGQMNIDVPVIGSLPGAPGVAVVQIQLVLAPRGLTYYEHVGHSFRPYHPLGLRLPEHCPPGGYPFALELSFLDGTRSSSATTVPCPAANHPR
jgi:hypothetical protein